MTLNKKASLEISIQAIVIVVLAMTLLGLGLGFVRGMFKNITSTTEDVTEQVRQKVLDDLITGDKKISFPKTEVYVDKGGSTVLTIGVRNKENAPLYYKMNFCAVSGPSTGASSTQPLTCNALENWFQYDSTKEYKLDPAESDIRSIRLSVPKPALAGSYFLTFDAINTADGSMYAQKDFFIIVRG